MKYIILIGDGMAGRPLAELGGRTVLQAASTPNMDRLAREGTRGMVRTVPPGMPAGSDVANMSILGYDPERYYSGRAPLEAASMGIELGEGDVAFRCNLVTLAFDSEGGNSRMEDYSAGHISTEEARSLLRVLDGELGTESVVFHPGVSYRHLMLWKGGEAGAECTPPHDIIGRDVGEYLPTGEGGEFLRELMTRSVRVLEGQEINRKRVSEGKNAANSIWLWGQGKKPALPSFRERFGLSAALVSAVDLTKGLGRVLGMDILDVPGVTGYLDTNYAGKAEYSLRALDTVDLVYIHVEAPDEAGHSGNYRDKLRAVEDFDRLVVGSVLTGLTAFGEYRVLLMPDHPTPVALRTHTADPVPFVIYDSRDVRSDEAAAYSEDIDAEEGVLRVERGHELMGCFITGSREERKVS
jgi:2,3-bisphosphoglycerate-independent phosphoglycerate mutase